MKTKIMQKAPKTRAEICAHENADHLFPGDEFTSYTLAVRSPQAVLVEQFRCLDCGGWLSLGQSDERDEDARIELRAAELSEDYGGEVSDFTQTEWAGWNCDERHSAGDFDLASVEWSAGYLAHCIDDHGEIEAREAA